MPKKYFLARVELHYCKERYEELHEKMLDIGFKRSWFLKNKGGDVEFPHATYMALAPSDASGMGKALRTQIKTEMKLPIRTPNSGKRPSFSYVVASIDGLKSGGLLMKRNTFADLMKLLEA